MRMLQPLDETFQLNGREGFQDVCKHFEGLVREKASASRDQLQMALNQKDTALFGSLWKQKKDALSPDDRETLHQAAMSWADQCARAADSAARKLRRSFSADSLYAAAVHTRDVLLNLQLAQEHLPFDTAADTFDLRANLVCDAFERVAMQLLEDLSEQFFTRDSVERHTIQQLQACKDELCDFLEYSEPFLSKLEESMHMHRRKQSLEDFASESTLEGICKEPPAFIEILHQLSNNKPRVETAMKDVIARFQKQVESTAVSKIDESTFNTLRTAKDIFKGSEVLSTCVQAALDQVQQQICAEQEKVVNELAAAFRDRNVGRIQRLLRNAEKAKPKKPAAPKYREIVRGTIGELRKMASDRNVHLLAGHYHKTN